MAYVFDIMTTENMKTITVSKTMWSFIVDQRTLVQRKERKGLETVDEVLRRLLGVDAK